MPNPPKPIEQKRRTGNPGKRKLPDERKLAAVPEIAYETWQLTPIEAIEKILADGVSWIAETDAPKVILLRKTLENLQKAELAGTLRDQLEAIGKASSLMSELGFDPTSRARLGLAEVKAASTLEKLRASQKK